MTETVHTYLFEAKSIQTFILATNRLKEIIGGSEMVEVLADSLLDKVLEAIEGKDNIVFSRRGGGAFFAFSEDKTAIDQLASLWPLCVRQHVPGLSFVQARSQGKTALAAFEDAHNEMLVNRNRVLARLPQASPFAVRNRRTGEPASVSSYTKGKNEPVDTVTARKLDFAKCNLLTSRFVSDETENGRTWPLNLSPSEGEKNDLDFPFIGENHTIGLVHADGNGLGQLLMNLAKIVKEKPAKYVDIFHGFSEAISGATVAAAQRATREVLEPKTCNTYPARPIVLGGDDLTIIVRADLALPFARAFLAAFAEESETRLSTLKNKFGLSGLPDRLTACAGIVYAKSSQPFHMLHGLAEGLCKHAKTLAKANNQTETPSSLCFHQVSTALIDDYGTILKSELTAGQFRHTLECYAIEAVKGLPQIKYLLDLQDLLADPNLSQGGSRELLGLIGRDPKQAKRHYARWREIMEDRHNDKLMTFDSLLKELTVIKSDSDLPYSSTTGDRLRRSPLGDAITLRSVGNLAETDAENSINEEVAQ